MANAEQQIGELARRFLPEIERCLREAVEAGGELAPMLRYHMGWETLEGTPTRGGGKALRPILCLAACEMSGGDWRDALPAASALELIHNFSLAHDDIQDGDETRRGTPTLWRIWGVPTALTAGNAMRVIADRTAGALTAQGATSDVARATVAELTRRYMEMIEGQYLDLSFETAEQVSVNDYLDMIGRKTGALLESAMHMGALVATGDHATAQGFGECGMRMGVAFQVRDDYLGVWGDPAFTGKPVGADIRRKKKSLPAVYLFESTPPEERSWLEETYRAEEIDGERLEGVMAMLERLGGDTYVQRIAEEQARLAVAAVEALAIPEESKRLLGSMAEFFVTRDM
ncbi:MAG: polyprenyl synthetase family protein [Chloroflexota bacterium]|nr:polyprenyl synthetase family protein [Chloroflexota bacterium]MDE2885050.1 polyprenyl synthetase family protein [Chloroflexota bacterium]